MLMKWLTNWQVSLVAAVLLTNALVSPSMAQTGNQSDATGAILSTGDFAGQTFPGTTTVTGFQGGGCWIGHPTPGSVAGGPGHHRGARHPTHSSERLPPFRTP